jgi:hypothetical protein
MYPSPLLGAKILISAAIRMLGYIGLSGQDYGGPDAPICRRLPKSKVALDSHPLTSASLRAFQA